MSMAAMIARFSISLPVVLPNQVLRAVGVGRIRQRARGDTERYVGCSARRRRPTRGSAGPGGNTRNNSARIGTRAAAAASPPPDTPAPCARPGAPATRSCVLSFCCALGSGVRPPSQCPKHPLDIDTQVGERAAEQRGATHEDHVIPVPASPAAPADTPRAGVACALLRSTAPPSRRPTAKPTFPSPATRPPERNEALQLLPPPALPENRLELARPKALPSAHREDTAGSPPHAPLDGQPLSPLRPASLQHLSTAQGLHALPESVRLLPAPDIGLKCSLHEVPFRS